MNDHDKEKKALLSQARDAVKFYISASCPVPKARKTAQ